MADQDSKIINRLNRQAKQRNDTVDAKVESFVSSLQLFLERNLRKILDDLRGGKVTAKEAAKTLGGLESAMEEAGLKERYNSIKALFKAEFKAVAEEFKDTTGKAALLSDFTKQNLDTLVNQRLDMAATYITDYLGDVHTAVLDSVIAGKSVVPAEVIATASPRIFANLQTEITTTVMAYQRVLHLEKADKAGTDKFLYIGPLDSITRDFCRENVGRIFIRQEIDAMDNGQGLPVSIYCGGYNCRHHWRPVSDELAQEIQKKE
jgi:hypothetical protein